MSCFDGIISEYRGISVDNFTGKNLRSSLFFLSHCHLDHMKGFTSNAFVDCLLRSDAFHIYCSEFTFELLTQRNEIFKVPNGVINRLVPLSCGYPQVVDVVDRGGIHSPYSLSVTLLPAGHCPGSVMFAFDGHSGRVLYTGDFRVYRGEAAGMQHLPTGLSALYLDSTFFVPTTVHIPTRKESIQTLCSVVRKHLRNHPQAKIYLECKTELGYESVFGEVLEQIEQKVHVSSKKYRLYEKAEATCAALTLDGLSTKLHACDKDGDCWKERSKNNLTIGLCAMSFVLQGQISKPIRKLDPTSYKICFSMHSSYAEILEFIEFVKPARIIPCAVPPNSTLQEMTRLLDKLVIASHAPKETSVEQTITPVVCFKPVNRSTRPLPADVLRSDSHDDLFDQKPRIGLKRLRVEDATGRAF